MSNLIVLNRSHYVENSGNKFSYRFPSTSTFDKKQVGLSEISLYNSVYNITSDYGNNTFSIIWNANTAVTYNFTIPNGYYSVSDLNYFIQQQCLLNNLYMVSTATGNPIYFVELVINSSRYAVQINSYVLPTSAQATTLGWTIPSGASWTAPTSTAKNAQFVIATVAFGLLLGQVGPITLPASVGATNVQYLSTITPAISVVSSLMMTCNLVNSKYTIPNNFLASVPLTNSFGSLIHLNNGSSCVYTDVIPASFNTIEVQFYDQLFNPITLHDLDVVITLSLRNSPN